jgi:Arc/MetJ family transcription regulator
MRTNIELDADLLAEARKYSRAKTKRALVEEALATYIAVKHEESRKRNYKDRLDSLRSKLQKMKVRSDVRDIIRQDRDSR